MSVDRRLLSGIVLGTALLAAPTAATQFDPLLAIPDALQGETVLPGDIVPAACPPERGAAKPLQLVDAIDLALCNNPQIRAAWAGIKSQAAALGEARAAYLPTLTGSVSRISDETRYPDAAISPSTVYASTANAALNWRLLDAGTRSANRQAAEYLLAAAVATHDATLQKTLAAVVQNYFDAVTAQASVIARTQAEEIAAQTLASAKRREAKGAIGQSDTLQAATAHARAALEKSRAESSYQKALATLTYTLGLVGVGGGREVALPDDPGGADGESIDTLRRWLDEAQKGHPAIASARAQRDAAVNKMLAVSSEGLPTLDLSSNYYRNGRPGQSLTPTQVHETTIGLVLTIPVFDGFARTYKVYGAMAQAEQKDAELAEIEQQVAMEIVKAHADAAAALKNLDASADLADTAQSALAVVQRRYDRNAGDMIELLNAQSALAEARLERIRCVAEWRSARLRLIASAGRMGRSSVAGETARR